MRKKKTHFRHTETGRSSSPLGGGIILFGFVAFVVVSFYLWGKVQVDFVLRESDRLGEKKQTLQREVADLQVQVNALKSYQRIVTHARNRGFVFVSASNLKELSVDMEGVNLYPRGMDADLQYAGFVPMGISRRKSNSNQIERK